MGRKRKKTQNDNNFAIAYYRFSSHAQNEASIDQQREAAENYARSRGLEIIKEYEDRAISGTTDDRPGFQQMLSEVDQIKPAALIVWKTDRLGRDRYMVTMAKKTIRDAGCRIHYVAEAIPGDGDDSPEAGLMEDLLDAMAAFYSKQLRQNITRGMRYNAENALFNGHNILGYKKGEDKKYVIDPEKAPVVQRIFEDYAAGKPMAHIAEELNAKGITTSRGGKFTVNGLRSVLHNDAYTGIYRYSDIVIEGGMPVLISNELFDRAQRRFAENKRKGGQRAHGLDENDMPRFWLTGKLYCGKCGHNMFGISGTSKTGMIHYYYACSQMRKHSCTKKSVKKKRIEELVIDVLAGFLEDTENLMSLAVDAAAYYRRYYVDLKYLEGLETSKKENEKALANLLKAIEAGVFTETTQTRMLELEERRKALTEAIEAEKMKQNLMQDEHSIKSYFSKFLHADFQNPEVRDMIMEYFVDKIYVYDDKLTITSWYSDDKTEVSWEELDGSMTEAEVFDCFVVGATMNMKRGNSPSFHVHNEIYEGIEDSHA